MHLDDEPRIRAAAALAEIDDALTALPRGYNTLLSREFSDDGQSRGVTLSGGQWQRVAVARSLVHSEADLLVLDAQAEHQLHTTLMAHRHGRANLLVSHRLNAIREADVILVLSRGRITERGSHDALMTEGGEYARLFQLQAAGYQDGRVSLSE